ncbi:hypothetical protein IW261DRAFT_1577716 [Armillaria novae-zelandiae]|uniref:Uncharacterized protein n=1 Tax=Armillaria novae-zelandiae TaxID=153914 RepID=A0AA39N7F1_9AGAR|nr:hypothetical protein IW261DRAFT_1577716 [Armillaria novae-zelandiae]
MDNMEDGKSSHLLNANRLGRLRELRLAWANLNWKKFMSISFSGECSAYELIASIFVKMFFGGVFVLTWLPSSTRPDVDQVELPDQDMLVKDFAMDPSQDLLAMLVDDALPPSYTTSCILTMHLQSLSTLNDHLEAEVPQITISIHPGETWANLTDSIRKEMNSWRDYEKCGTNIDQCGGPQMRLGDGSGLHGGGWDEGLEEWSVQTEGMAIISWVDGRMGTVMWL